MRTFQVSVRDGKSNQPINKSGSVPGRVAIRGPSRSSSNTAQPGCIAGRSTCVSTLPCSASSSTLNPGPFSTSTGPPKSRPVS